MSGLAQISATKAAVVTRTARRTVPACLPAQCQWIGKRLDLFFSEQIQRSKDSFVLQPHRSG